MTIYRWERDGHVPQPKRITRTQECFYTTEDVEILRLWRDDTAGRRGAKADKGKANIV
jgi:hypothetical protein